MRLVLDRSKKSTPKYTVHVWSAKHSKSYDDEATSLLVYFYMNYFGSKNLSVEHIDSYNIHKERKERYDRVFLKDDYKEDLTTLKDELQVRGYTIPTLYKQYNNLCNSCVNPCK